MADGDGRFSKEEHMDCAKCKLHIPEGVARCPNCLSAVPRPSLLSRLTRELRAMLVTKRTTEIRTRIQVRDGQSGEMRTYSSLDDAPAEIRQQIQQAQDSGASTKITVNTSGRTTTKITVRDSSGVTRTYESIDQLPPDIRALYERTLKQSSSPIP
jgi:hypothetical protein